MNYGKGQGMGGILGFPPAISQLVLINAIIFLVQMLLPEPLLYRLLGSPVSMIPNLLALVPHQVAARGMVALFRRQRLFPGGHRLGSFHEQ